MLESKVRDEQEYKCTYPKMYDDLLRSLGSNAKATVRTSLKFEGRGPPAQDHREEAPAVLDLERDRQAGGVRERPIHNRTATS